MTFSKLSFLDSLGLHSLSKSKLGTSFAHHLGALLSASKHLFWIEKHSFA